MWSKNIRIKMDKKTNIDIDVHHKLLYLNMDAKQNPKPTPHV